MLTAEFAVYIFAFRISCFDDRDDCLNQPFKLFADAEVGFFGAGRPVNEGGWSIRIGLNYLCQYWPYRATDGDGVCQDL